ncbi:MAG: hypothetical protein ABSA01_12250, partial [Anaerolineales bacterium]
DQQRLQVLLVGFVHVSVPRLWLSPIILNFYHSRDPFFREAICVYLKNYPNFNKLSYRKNRVAISVSLN